MNLGGITVSSIYEFKMKRLDGSEQSFADYRGKVLMFVNVASFCGNTPQYTGLEEIYKRYHAKGLEILGFPANNFGAQEPGTDKEIAEFCGTNYGVTFPLFSKISVKGRNIHPIYTVLTSSPKPIGGDVTWNFQKFLVDRQGNVTAKFNPSTSPGDKSLVSEIEELLKQQ